MQSTITGRAHMSNRTRAVVVGCLAVVAAACGTTTAPDALVPSGAQGRVRLVNVITDATRGRVNASLEGLVFGVDINYAVSAPANLPAPSTAPYKAVLAGNRAFILKRTADTTVTVATLNFTVAEGEDRSVYAIGGAGGSAITGFVLTDVNTAAAATETRLRLVNMSPTAGPLDVFLTAVGADLATAAPRATSLAYQAASAYFTVAPGTYQYRAVPAGTAPANRAGNVTITLSPVALAGGTGRTIVAADNSAGGAPLRAFVLTDR
ncbi:MAG: DUF4397 domain-containing protein [Gemmatimonadaceae bacterium]|nr:DUF4397 domain-containing protein [Gemmatimonadaceae bacterium]